MRGTQIRYYLSSFEWQQSVGSVHLVVQYRIELELYLLLVQFQDIRFWADESVADRVSTISNAFPIKITRQVNNTLRTFVLSLINYILGYSKQLLD